MKFPVNLRKGFDIEKDEVKFCFNMTVFHKQSAKETI